MPARTDSRSIITAESFSVAPQLLGLPLARPWRRAAAILLDLMPVAILANAGLTMFLAFIAAFLVWRTLSFAQRAGFLPRRLGALVRFGASIAALAFVMSLGNPFRRDGNAEDQDPIPPDSIAAIVRAAQSIQSGTTARTTVPAADALSADSALQLYTYAVSRGDNAAAETLRTVAGTALAGERIREMQDEIDGLRSDNIRLEQRPDRDAGGLTAWVSTIADDLGIGFGWGALYFTTFLVLGKGQTPGKRVMGIRVIRLDARPIGWWIAFERFGSYFASLSTGMLGFLQIYWDRNRQALHDKAIETVVIRVTPKSANPVHGANAPPRAHR